MRKEIFLAIIAGGGLGLVIAFGIWRANIFLKPKSNSTPAPTSVNTKNPSTSIPVSGDLKIVLAKPFNQAVLTETPTVISGITRPQTFVVVSGEDGEDIMNSSDSGAFNSNTDLEGGINQIQLDAFDTDGNQTHSSLLLVYSSQFEATSSAVAQAYIGTVTDISNSVIQIKTDSGDIEQISSTTNTSYIDSRNNTTKQIKLTDIAIGDYLVAMGTKDTNNILNSSRILVTDSISKTTRRAFYGIVTDDSGMNKFIAKNPKTNETITITPGTGIKVTGTETSLGKIVNDEKVIAVGEFKDGTLIARTIQVMK